MQNHDDGRQAERVRLTVGYWVGIVSCLFMAAMIVFGDVSRAEMPFGRWIPAALCLLAAFGLYYALKRDRLVSRVGQQLFSGQRPTIDGDSQGRVHADEDRLPIGPAAVAVPVDMVEADSLLGVERVEINAPPTWRDQIFSYVVALGIMATFIVMFSSGWWGLLMAAGIIAAWGIAYKLFFFFRPRGRPADLLILRVFGRGGIARAIAEVWQWDEGATTLLAGPEWMDTSPDAATVFAAADAPDPVATVAARGRAIRNSADLEEALERRKVDFFRQHILICNHGVWREAVTRLVDRAEYVLFDLSGFHGDAEGCRFELELLMERIPLDRVLYVIDAETDWPTVKTQMDRACARRSVVGMPLTVLRFAEEVENHEVLKHLSRDRALLAFRRNLFGLIRRADARTQDQDGRVADSDK